MKSEKTVKGKIADIYEVRKLTSKSIVQRFRLTTADGKNEFFNLFNNVELLNSRKVGDDVVVEYNPKTNGQFINNYVNDVYGYNPDSPKQIENAMAVYDNEFKGKYGIEVDTRKYKELKAGESMGTSKYF